MKTVQLLYINNEHVLHLKYSTTVTAQILFMPFNLARVTICYEVSETCLSNLLTFYHFSSMYYLRFLAVKKFKKYHVH